MFQRIFFRFYANFLTFKLSNSELQNQHQMLVFLKSSQNYIKMLLYRDFMQCFFNGIISAKSSVYKGVIKGLFDFNLPQNFDCFMPKI